MIDQDGGTRCGPSLARGFPGRLHPFPPTSPRTSWPLTLLTELTVLCLHLLLFLVTVIVIVGVVLYVLEAEAGHAGHVGAHLLGAPVGWDAGGSAGPRQDRVGDGAQWWVLRPDCFEASILPPHHPHQLLKETPGPPFSSTPVAPTSSGRPRMPGGRTPEAHHHPSCRTPPPGAPVGPDGSLQGQVGNWGKARWGQTISRAPPAHSIQPVPAPALLATAKLLRGFKAKQMWVLALTQHPISYGTLGTSQHSLTSDHSSSQ